MFANSLEVQSTTSNQSWYGSITYYISLHLFTLRPLIYCIYICLCFSLFVPHSPLPEWTSSNGLKLLFSMRTQKTLESLMVLNYNNYIFPRVTPKYPCCFLIIRVILNQLSLETPSFYLYQCFNDLALMW